MKAKMDVATTATVAAPKALPPLETVPLAPGKIALAVPLRVGYAALTEALNAAVKGKEFSVDTPAGKASATVKNLVVYPSKENLVCGIEFSAKLPGRFLDTNGTVYLLAQPFVEKNSQIIKLGNARFARILDNDVWSVLSAIFEGKIRSELTKAGTVDLAPTIAMGLTSLKAELDKLAIQSGVTVQLEGETAGIRQIVPAETDLVVEAVFEAVANLIVKAK